MIKKSESNELANYSWTGEGPWEENACMLWQLSLDILSLMNLAKKSFWLPIDQALQILIWTHLERKKTSISATAQTSLQLFLRPLILQSRTSSVLDPHVSLLKTRASRLISSFGSVQVFGFPPCLLKRNVKGYQATEKDHLVVFHSTAARSSCAPDSSAST